MSPSSSLSAIPPPAPLRVAIIAADTGYPRYGGYFGLYTSLLQAAADALGWPRDRLETSAWEVVNVKEGAEWEYPKLEEVDAVLISGSSESWSELHGRFLEEKEMNLGVGSFDLERCFRRSEGVSSTTRLTTLVLP